MVELSNSSGVWPEWKSRVREARTDPAAAARLAREANHRGEHMLAASVAEAALRRLSLVSPGDQAVPLRQQLALALARSGATQEAAEVLRDGLVASREDAETLGLLGRVHKDLAERAPTPASAAEHLRAARDFYARGFAMDRNTYCGINAAVLAVLTGDLALARQTARCILESEPDPDRLWSAATTATAWMICGEQERARSAFRNADRAGETRRSDLAAVRREARRIAAALHGNAVEYEDCFTPAAVAIFHGSAETWGEAEQARAAHWLEENHVVCVWSAAACGEEAGFLACASALGIETCAVLPEAQPRKVCSHAVARAALVEVADPAAAESAASAALARHLASARAAARAASWDVPLLPLAGGPSCPPHWRKIARAPCKLREGGAEDGAAPDGEAAVTAQLCISVDLRADNAAARCAEIRAVWEEHGARCGSASGNGGPFFFGWPTMAEAARATLHLQRQLQRDTTDAACAFILHASGKAHPDAALERWARRVYPGRVHATGRFADLAALEMCGDFEISYVGMVDCEAEPMGLRLYRLRDRGAERA